MFKAFLGFIILAMSLNSFAEVYSVYVKRESSNLYRDSSGVYIETNYCYEYTYGDEAILRYSDNSYDNKIIFSGKPLVS